MAMVRGPAALLPHADPPTTSAAPAGGWRVYVRRALALVPQRIGAFAVFCVLMWLSNGLRVAVLAPVDDPLWLRAALGTSEATYLMFFPPPLFVALILSEAIGLRGAAHLWVSALFVAIAALVVRALADFFALDYPMVRAGLVASESVANWRNVWFNLAGCILLVVYFSSRTREAESARLAEAAEAERVTTERATLGAHLKVMQAQVEPGLLFRVLEDVRELYGRAPAEADALLDDLVAYLRAALPQMRGEASTVRQEAILAASYVKVLPDGRDGRIRVELAIAEEAGEHPFPPMVLLPLTQAAAQPGARVVTIASAPNGVSVAIDAPQGPERWNDEYLAPLRTTMATFFGADAGIAIDASKAVAYWS